jgi:hypothetical protein
LYNYIDPLTRFRVVPWFGLAGVLLTEILLPDTTGLDLREQERYWHYVLDGRESEYHGVAVHPRHLSFWERYVQKRDRYYDPALDRAAKIEELRATWEALEREKITEKAGEIDDEDGRGESSVDPDEASFISDDVASYFRSEKARSHTSLLGRGTGGAARDGNGSGNSVEKAD